MPVVMLKNVSDKERKKIASALREEFPELLNELCINRIITPVIIIDRGDTCEPQAYVDTSPEFSEKKLERIKHVVCRFVLVLPRPSEGDKSCAWPFIVYSGLGLSQVRCLEKLTGLQVRWHNANPRLLSGQYAPYAEYHKCEASKTKTLKTIRLIQTVCDVEVWDPDLSEFYPKK